jgi:hypothetical protein
MTPLDVERHLRNWSEWMRSGGGVRGYPRSVPGIMVGGNIASWEDLCDSCDKVAARSTDAAVADLPGVEQAAVSHIHLAAVWRFNREPLSTVYERALISLGESLTRKGMV